MSFALLCLTLGGAYLLLEVGCRDKPAKAGQSWFDVYPHLPISKKARGRGDVNRDGLTRREQAHGRFNPK